MSHGGSPGARAPLRVPVDLRHGEQRWSGTTVEVMLDRGVIDLAIELAPGGADPAAGAVVVVSTPGGELAGVLPAELVVDTGASTVALTVEDARRAGILVDPARFAVIGTGASGFIRKSAFALRFGDVNPLISGNIKADSKVLLERDVRERVQALGGELEATSASGTWILRAQLPLGE